MSLVEVEVQLKQAEREWQASKSLHSFEKLGICYGCMLQNQQNPHWFTGDNIDAGIATFIFYTYDEDNDIKTMQNEIFAHLMKCGPCTAVFETRINQFAQIAADLGAPEESLTEAMKKIHKDADERWVSHTKQQLLLYEGDPQNKAVLENLAFCLVAALNGTQLIFNKEVLPIIKYFNVLEPLALELGQFKWGPGYFAVLAFSFDQTTENAIIDRLNSLKPLEATAMDESVYQLVFSEFEKQYPAAASVGAPKWDHLWSLTGKYVDALAPAEEKKKFATIGIQRMKKCRHIGEGGATCAVIFGQSGVEVSTATRQACRSDLVIHGDEAAPSFTALIELIKDRVDKTRPFLYQLLGDSAGLKRAKLGLLAFSFLNQMGQDDAFDFVRDFADVFIATLAQTTIPYTVLMRDLIDRAAKSENFPSLISAVRTSIGSDPAGFACKSLIFTSIQPRVFSEYFSAYRKSDVVITPTNSDKEVVDILASTLKLDKQELDGLCDCKGVLSTIWLFRASTDPQTAEIASELLRSINSSHLTPSNVIDEFIDTTHLISSNLAYALVPGCEELIKTLPPLGDNNNVRHWDHLWQFIAFSWNTGNMLNQGFTNAFIKSVLRAATECAEKTISSWPAFLKELSPEVCTERLSMVADALIAGEKLLSLTRATKILGLIYNTFVEALLLFNMKKVAVPRKIQDFLDACIESKRANELSQEERKNLKNLLDAGVARAARSQSTSGSPSLPSTQPAPAPAPAPFSSPAPVFKTQLSMSDGGIQRYFNKVPREDAIAATQKLVPPTKPEPPKEQSALAQMRANMEASRIQRPAPAKIGPAVPIHPPRPAGFNRKDKHSEPTDKPKPLRPEATADKNTASHDMSSDSSSGDESDSGIFRVGKRRIRNIDNAGRLGPNSLNKRMSLRPPQADEKAQEQARMNARMLSSADNLHRAVLSWDYFQEGMHPPNASKTMFKVPDTFTDAAQYKSIMDPLLLMETWQQIQQQKMSREKSFFLDLGKRETVDDFVDFYVSMRTSDYKEARLTENDLLLVAVTETKTPAPISSQSPTRIFAKIKEGSISLRKDVADFVIRTYRAEQFTSRANQKSQITAERICSLVTAEREYRALDAFEHNELRRQILAAEPAPRVDINDIALNQMTSNIGLNGSQSRAVYQALNSPGLNLIQGPPGTGKTKTILGIIGSFLSHITVGKRILVCTPSNAAVDELLMRLKGGIKNTKGETIFPKLVRIGRPESVSPAVADLCLERQVELGVTTVADKVDSSLQIQINTLKKEDDEIRAQTESTESNRLSEEQVTSLLDRRAEIKKSLDENYKLLKHQREQLDVSRKTREAEYKKAQTEILTNAQVVCATLSGSASSILSSLKLVFPVVIVDEAAQSVELSTLIPFRYGCKSCILVGDPNQLPPTVMSKAASDLNYEQSLFTRIFKQHQDKVSMLDMQFRMHPEIASFPSKEFYKGLLKDGPDMASKCERPWHKSRMFPPYQFYTIRGSASVHFKSFVNTHEVEAAVELIAQLFKNFPDYNFKDQIGIISPYKQQVNTMRNRFKMKFGDSIVDSVTFSTIDAFQGQEKDIIVFSTVRASEDKSTIGFVGDVRRMNVAITRARASLWILGHTRTLVSNSEWQRLITDSQKRSLYTPASAEELKGNNLIPASEISPSGRPYRTYKAKGSKHRHPPPQQGRYSGPSQFPMPPPADRPPVDGRPEYERDSRIDSSGSYRGHAKSGLFNVKNKR